MLKKLVLTLGLLLIASPLGAVNWYFSDCATGGSGTESDPFCLQPPNSSSTNYSTKVSIDSLFDTTATTGGCYTPPCTNGLQEAQAGDNIYLCCGGTDGCGDETTSCTHNVGISSSTKDGTWWTPDLNPGNISLRSYPGDRVTISGDTDADGIGEQPGDVGTIAFVSGQHFYSISDITFKEFTENGFYIEAPGGSPTEGDWGFDRVFLDQIGKDGWGDTDGLGNNPGCTIDGSTGGYAIYLWGISKPIVFQNGGFSRVCGMVIRDIVSYSTNHEVLFRNNLFTNNTIIANVWDTYDWQNLRGQTFKFIDNTVISWAMGLVLENRNRGAIIDHNTFLCSEDYDMMSLEYSRRECWPAIEVNGGDWGNRRNGGNAGHQITRNTIKGARKTGDSSSLNGWLWGGIKWDDGCRRNSECFDTSGDAGFQGNWCCCTGVGTGVCNSTSTGGTCSTGSPNEKFGCNPDVQYGSLLENNIIHGTHSILGGVDVGRAGIGVNTNNRVFINHNTVVGNENSALYLNDGANITTGVGFPVMGNILGYSSGLEVFLAASTVDATLVNNHIYAPSGNIFQKSGSSALACADIASINALGENSGNVCASAPVFVSQSGTNYPTWNPHLFASDATNYNALSNGPANDIDYDLRPMDPTGISATPYDRGADEVRPEELTIEWGQTTTTLLGDTHCGPFGAPDDNATFRPSYHNYGSLGATNVTMVFSWTSDATYVSTTCPSCVNAGDLLTCTVGTLAAQVAGSCNIVLACPSVTDRHGLQIGADISSDQKAICATDESIIGCGNFPSPAITQGLP